MIYISITFSGACVDYSFPRVQLSFLFNDTFYDTLLCDYSHWFHLNYLIKKYICMEQKDISQFI